MHNTIDMLNLFLVIYDTVTFLVVYFLHFKYSLLYIFHPYVVIFTILYGFCFCFCSLSMPRWSIFTVYFLSLLLLLLYMLYMTFNYLKFILEYNSRYGSNHILLPNSLHLAQHFLLNNICFSPLIQYDNFRESASH